MNDRRVSTRWLWMVALVAHILGGCGNVAETSSAEQSAVVQCTRDEPVLRGPAVGCVVDSDCGCGSYCDAVAHTCKFSCMIPPANQAESCAPGTQCDNTGRCTVPGQAPATSSVLMTVSPQGFNTIAGGAATGATAQLSVAEQSAVAAAQTTTVRVLARDGAEVSCDAISFGAECALDSWAFSWNDEGTRHIANRQLWVRTKAGTAVGHGEFSLRIDALDRELSLPATVASTSSDGEYHGVAVSSAGHAGHGITATARGNLIVVRDPTRTIAPDGALILDLGAAKQTRHTAWLRPPGAAPTAGAIAATYVAGTVVFTPVSNSLTVPLTLNVSTWGTELLDTYSLRLQRIAPPAAACSASKPCAVGEVCVAGVQACVPSVVATPPALAGNQFEDPRSAEWWNAMKDTIGAQGSTTGRPEFATQRADLIESLMCSTTAGAGHLGAVQVKDTGGKAHSGDLECLANGTGTQNDDGAPNGAAGAIGLGTYLDRTGAASSSDLFATCIADLARPVTTNFATNFATGTGACVNLARALPALRLLGTGELNKATRYSEDRRLQTLLARLVQQWSELHGFLASTGLAGVDLDQAISAAPADVRHRMGKLLDVADAGWSALLDKRLAGPVKAISRRAAGDESTTFTPELDYRVAKQPALYWTFNGPTPNQDLIHQVPLISPTSDPRCQLNARFGNLRQGSWSCPPLQAQLPAAQAHVLDSLHQTFVFHLHGLGDMAPPSEGGIFISPTLQVEVSIPDRQDGSGVLTVHHPFNDGRDVERVDFPEFGAWAGYRDDSSADITVAIIRDGANLTYTLFVRTRCDGADPLTGCPADRPFVFHTVTRGFGDDVSGAFMSPPAIIAGRQLCLYGSEPSGPTHDDICGFEGGIDDFAILNYKISPREFLRFADARADGFSRDLWPTDRDTASYPTQTLFMPVGASILEGQVAHLDAVLRLIDLLGSVGQAACENHSGPAQTELDAAVLRIGRTLRQNAALVQLTKDDLSTAAQKARQLLASKRAQISRTVEQLRACRSPFGMAEREVPLYFNSIAPNISEKAAFFAASDHLLSLAEDRTATAQAALTAVRTSWEQARQSQIQQVLTDTARDIRIGEVQTKYGESMRRLCGISDLTATQIADQLEDGTLSPSTCYVKPTVTCLTQNANTPVTEIDPSCYRGVIGGAFLDIRTAYFAHQAADRAWQAAMGNSVAAEKLCVLKEMDLYGCSALDRHQLAGVQCPAGHEGTLQLISNFNAYLDKKEESRGMWRAAAAFTAAFGAAIAASIATGGIAAPTLILAGAAASEYANMATDTIESRRRAHELVLTARSAEDAIRTCWSSAEQFQRAIGSAEQSAKEALARMDSARLAFENGLAEARALALEAPVVIQREKTRPSVSIAFHYWLPELLEDYKLALTSARRYAYIALRATEYDALESFGVSQLGKPDRASVLDALRPSLLSQQLQLMRDQTNNRQTSHGPPALKRMAFDIGDRFFGIGEGSDQFGTKLTGFLRPVYSKQGEYLGQGLRISLIPTSGLEEPKWRCAERIWRVNAGASALPATGDGVTLKLQKRNVFASRRCGSEGLQVSTLRPGGNLLVAAGEPQSYTPAKDYSVADITLQNFNDGVVFEKFKSDDLFSNGSSSELSLQGLWGDYVLLFPAGTFSDEFTSSTLRDFWLRFDYLSVDDTPASAARPSAQLALDPDPSPITVD